MHKSIQDVYVIGRDMRRETASNLATILAEAAMDARAIQQLLSVEVVGGLKPGFCSIYAKSGPPIPGKPLSVKVTDQILMVLQRTALVSNAQQQPVEKSIACRHEIDILIENLALPELLSHSTNNEEVEGVEVGEEIGDACRWGHLAIEEVREIARSLEIVLCLQV